MEEERNNEDLKLTDFIPIFGFKNYVDRNIGNPTPNYFRISKLLAIYNPTILTLGIVIAGEGLVKLLYN